MSVARALDIALGVPDAGLVAAVVVATAVTALVALGMMLVALHRRSRLTALRALATVGVAIGVAVIGVGGVLAVAPSPAQAAPDPAGPTYVVSTSGTQLPTLPLD